MLQVSHQASYSAHKRLGGGVSIDLIHEWDYMSYLFGFPDKVVNMRGTYSKLEIDSDQVPHMPFRNGANPNKCNV